MSSYDATSVIADTIKAQVRQPKAPVYFFVESDEQIALSIIDALEEAGFGIARRTSGQVSV